MEHFGLQMNVYNRQKTKHNLKSVRIQSKRIVFQFSSSSQYFSHDYSHDLTYFFNSGGCAFDMIAVYLLEN